MRPSIASNARASRVSSSPSRPASASGPGSGPSAPTDSAADVRRASRRVKRRLRSHAPRSPSSRVNAFTNSSRCMPWRAGAITESSGNATTTAHGVAGTARVTASTPAVAERPGGGTRVARSVQMLSSEFPMNSRPPLPMRRPTSRHDSGGGSTGRHCTMYPSTVAPSATRMTTGMNGVPRSSCSRPTTAESVPAARRRSSARKSSGAAESLPDMEATTRPEVSRSSTVDVGEISRSRSMASAAAAGTRAGRFRSTPRTAADCVSGAMCAVNSWRDSSSMFTNSSATLARRAAACARSPAMRVR